MSVKENLSKCQVFTPIKIAKKMLNYVKYTNDITNKYILENSCGHGNILEEIAKRYIKDGIRKNLTVEEIKKGLETYIYAYDIDANCCKECVKKLDRIASQYNIHETKWKIYNEDFLRSFCDNKIAVRFDFIIGNPPYINYTELSQDVRNFLKGNFKSCKKGKFDYCYPFIEVSLELLSKNGYLSYIIPNSIFKNVYAENLRNIMLPFIYKIEDFSKTNVFENVLTSPIVFVCRNKNNENYISYKNKSIFANFKISKNTLTNKWVFTEENISNNKQTFGDLFHASITIATLYNKAFIFDKKSITNIDDNYVFVNNFKIERSAIKPCVSPRSIAYNRSQFIIFPYVLDEINTLLRFNSILDYRLSFPRTAEYLGSFKSKLLKRDADNSARWFEYGRSQALKNIHQSKLLLSTIITHKVMVYELGANAIPYSGIFITAKNGNDLKLAKKILESKNFFKYVQSIGTSANGSSKRITVKDINNYIL